MNVRVVAESNPVVAQMAKVSAMTTFLNRPRKKKCQALYHIFIMDYHVPLAGKLRHHFFLMHNRPRNQLRKEAYKNSIIQKIIFSSFLSVVIN